MSQHGQFQLPCPPIKFDHSIIIHRECSLPIESPLLILWSLLSSSLEHLSTLYNFTALVIIFINNPERGEWGSFTSSEWSVQIELDFLFKLDNFIRTELTNHLLLAQSYWMLFEEESTLHFYSTIEPTNERTRRSIWPRLALTADKTWMITTPVHYQRRSSSSSSSHRSTHRVVVGSGSLCRFTSFITYPFLLLFLYAIIIIIHLPRLYSWGWCWCCCRCLCCLLMTIIIAVIEEVFTLLPLFERSLTRSLARSFVPRYSSRRFADDDDDDDRRMTGLLSSPAFFLFFSGGGMQWPHILHTYTVDIAKQNDR